MDACNKKRGEAKQTYLLRFAAGARKDGKQHAVRHHTQGKGYLLNMTLYKVVLQFLYLFIQRHDALCTTHREREGSCVCVRNGTLLAGRCECDICEQDFTAVSRNFHANSRVLSLRLISSQSAFNSFSYDLRIDLSGF